MVPLLLAGSLYPEARTLFTESATSETDPARHCAAPSFSVPEGVGHQSRGCGAGCVVGRFHQGSASEVTGSCRVPSGKGTLTGDELSSCKILLVPRCPC